MIVKNFKLSEFKQNGVSIKQMNIAYAKGGFRLYTYGLGGFLCGALLSAVDFDGDWNCGDLEVDVVYIAECDCSSIKNLWIGDDGNLYYPDIDEIFESLKVLRDLVEVKQ